MISIGVFDLFLRGVAGGLVVVLITYLADNLGPKVGGLLSAFPTVTSVSLIIIALNQGGEFAAEAALSTSIGLIAAAVFAIGFYLGGRIDTENTPVKTLVATSVGLVVYFVFVFGHILYAQQTSVYNFGLLAVGLALAHVLLTAIVPSEESRARDRTVGWVEYGTKTVFGGLIVLGATLAADVLEPVWGGMFSAFPATIAPILIIVSLTQSPAFVDRMIVFIPSALAGTGAFVVGVWFGVPRYGITAGIVIGYLLYGLVVVAIGELESRIQPLTSRLAFRR